MADSSLAGRALIEPERTFQRLWRANLWELRVARNWARRVIPIDRESDASYGSGLSRVGQVVVAFLAVLVIRLLVGIVFRVFGAIAGLEPRHVGTLGTAPRGRSVSPNAAWFELWIWLIGTGCVIALGVWMGIRRTRDARAAQTEEAA